MGFVENVFCIIAAGSLGGPQTDGYLYASLALASLGLALALLVYVANQKP
jgi:hypothetical protein